MKRTIKQIDKEIAELKEQSKNINGKKCEVYTRITGYYRPVDTFNRGKRHEYSKRKVFKI